MLYIFLFFILGILIGLIAGLVPGIHPNLFALLVSTIFIRLFSEPIYALVFLVSMGITNSIASFIPTIILGAPDPEDSLAALPGHRMLLKGLGYYAIKLTVLGSIVSIFLSILLLFFISPILQPSYQFLRRYIHIILLIVVFALIIKERKIFTATFCFILSGILGIVSLSIPINRSLLLFPILTGLFGLPMLIISLKNEPKIPFQSTKEMKISKKTINKNLFLGTVAGFITGILPGVGAAQATAIASIGERNDEGFLISIGATTTANILFSFLSIWLIGRPRSGLAVAVSKIMQIGFDEFVLMIMVSLLSGLISAFLTLKISKKVLNYISNIDYKKLNISVIILISVVTLWLTGIYGILLLITSTSLGLFTILSNVRRMHLMGVLILPTILFFAGVL